MTTRTISVSPLARIEGDAALRLDVRGGEVTGADLRVVEPPRFFEALLRGRRFEEVPDIVARICGICPVAHQLTAIHALERACAIRADPQVEAIRRLAYLGEWIESHSLHVYLLHAPDFLGLPDAIQLAALNAPLVERGLRLKKIGNEILRTVGGREVHPINLKVGGLYRLPSVESVRRLATDLRWARDASIETVHWTGALRFPDVALDYDWVSLRDATGYPLTGGRLLSASGLNLGPDEYERTFGEEHVERSNALHSTLPGTRPFIVGPLARFNMNADRLGEPARAAADDVALRAPCANPFKSIVVRAVELVQACDDALAIVESYARANAPSTAARPTTGRVAAWSEAPRGLLYHRYDVGDDGCIDDARIIPPSAQNQHVMERDLAHVAGKHLDLPEDELTWRCEQAIRNYDPCISCATHFLKLEVRRER